jgi:ribA/ribD-fused uncharacterized protein
MHLLADFDPALPPIQGFRGEFDFLSNFYHASLEFKGVRFVSSEQAYVWSKTDDPIIKDVILSIIHSAKLKRYGSNGFATKPKWKEIKTSVMLEILRVKFGKNDHLKQKLLATGKRYIEETNWWNDTFWGVCNGVGENRLGNLLMLVRTELQEENG